MTTIATPIQRRYIAVDGRLVHYRCCGAGPAVVMLHDSPRSSRLHLDTMRVLGRHFRVFALDTPGYGNSDPLGLDAPQIADFADALGSALAALGLERAPIYATHTSAKIALSLAASQGIGSATPLLLLDGLSIPDHLPPPDFITAYMRPFRLDDAGSYLAAEWSRIRDMLRWFPWFDTSPAKRTAAAPPTAEWMADYLIDLFAAGPHYADAYGAAMGHGPMADLLAVSVPTLVAARADDVLYGSLDKVPAGANPALTVVRLPADRDAWLEWLERNLREGCGDAAPCANPAADSATARSLYLDLPHGQLRLHRRAAGPARPVLVLAAPTTLHAHAWAEALGEGGPVLVPELPGFGESDPLAHPDADGFADVLAVMLDAAECGAVDVLGIGLAAPLAARLAARHPGKVRALVIDGAPPLDPAEAAAMAQGICPPVEFDPLGGSHLHRVWHMLRDGEVQWPWHDPARAAVRHLPPRLSAADLHPALLGVMMQPAQYGDAARAALAACSAADWAAVKAPALVFSHPHEPSHRPAPAIAQRMVDARIIHRPDNLAEAAHACRALLAGIAS